MKLIRASFLLVFFLLPGLKIYSQNLLDTTFIDLKKFWGDTKDIFNMATHPDKNDLISIAGITAGTAVLSTLDNSVKNFSLNSGHRSSFCDKLFKIDNYYGTTLSAFEIVAVTYLTGVAFKSPAVRKAGIMIGESALYSSIITQIIKRILGRERPEYTDNKYHFIGPNLSRDQFQALPSGHATCAFAVSTVAAGLVKNTYLKILFFTPAFLTSYARIYNNRHWFSDVVLGGVIGYLTGTYVVNKNNMPNNISSNIIINNGNIMISFSYNF